MTQTLAIFLDAYRELNARKLFWITLLLTGVFISGFATIGFNEQGLTMLGHQFELPIASTLYKVIFSFVVVGFWLTWAATILALISTAGIFPDLLTGGSVELYLARPMSRLRLFFTKYVSGLLFVAVQVIVVAIGGFVVMGLRGRIWMPSILLAIPIVMLLFSYLYAICVLAGVWSRSTVTALLITLLAWSLCFVAEYAEKGILQWQRLEEHRLEEAQRTIAEADADLRRYAAHPDHDLLGFKAGIARKRREIAVNSLPALEGDTNLPRTLHKFSYALRVCIPKTTETTKLLDRWMFTDQEAVGRDERQRDRAAIRGRDKEVEREEAAIDVEEIERHRSMTWIIGSSLIDEALLIGAAAWIFCRRDY